MNLKRVMLWLAPLTLLMLAVPVWAQSEASKPVELTLTNSSGAEFFRALEQATGVPIKYTPDQAERLASVTLISKGEPLNALLTRVLHNTGLEYTIKGGLVVLTTKKPVNPKSVEVSGIVYDDLKEPLIGASVFNKKHGVMQVTDINGSFRFKIPKNTDVNVRFSFVGSATTEHTFKAKEGKIIYDFVLQSSGVLDEVVVTGIYTRKLGNFTGSSSQVGAEQLSSVGNQNLLSSLSTIDPSIYTPINLLNGSDPNALPDISLRGTSSLATSEVGSLKGDFANNPNQPLFILDGFETSMQTIVDMDMNRVESVTVLKDASAKALYGSKAANGVIVIETKKLSGDSQRVTYNADVSFEIPDLSSYNLTNSLEKLEVELLDGVYESKTQTGQIQNRQLYNQRRKKALEGLNTYWLAKPLRTGIGQKHNLSIEVGDAKSLRANVDFSYNKIGGVMKGSDRTNLATTANLSYRRDKVIFRNSLTILANTAISSPYGSFSDYARMNPFWEAEDERGNIKRFAERVVNGNGENIANPMYNATIGTHKSDKYYDFTDNFYAEWQALRSLKGTVRLGWNKKLSEGNNFLPPDHSEFNNKSQELSDEKGSYTLTNGQSERISADFNINYSEGFGKHSLFMNGGVFVAQSKSSSYGHTAVGFSNTQIADITFAKQYKKGSTPRGSSTINRELSFLMAGSYDYDNRYLLDATFRRSASSLYGASNRWSNSWSFGMGWNIHNEPWLKYKPLQQLKLRASMGLTGNQNFLTNTSVATYKYYSGKVYSGFTGAYIVNMPNPDLKWEQKWDKNIGLDLRIWGLNFTLDLYQADTRNMLTDLSTPPSTGFSTVKDNLGLVRNSGIETRFSYALWRGKDGFVNIHGSAAHNKNYIVSLSESLREYNKKMMDESKNSKESGRPVQLYQDGQSMTTIFLVPSVGIDPMTGKEVFIKKNGELTYKYDPRDLQPLGDTAPLVRGNFGLGAEYKGVGLNVTCTYEVGGHTFNSTLIEKVENADITYNVDKRLAEGRWRKPGQVTKYKQFDSAVKTRSTSRFLQVRNDLNLASVQLYYQFPRQLIKSLHMEHLRVALFMNNIATFSSIEVERGTSYPFARRLSCSVTATF